MRRGRMFWGVLLLLVGGLLLLDNLGFLPVDFGQLLWPSFIILIGLWIILRGRLSPVRLESEDLSIPREGMTKARLKLRHGAGIIQVGPGAAPETLLQGKFLGGVSERRRVVADLVEVDLSVPFGFGFGFPWGSAHGFDWSIQLRTEVAYEITIESGAGELDMDLDSLQVNKLELKTGASSSKIHLPSVVENCRVKLEAGVASVKLYLPANVGARVTTEMGLAELKVNPDRFGNTGSGYETADFAEAEHKIEIAIGAGVSSVEII